MIPRRIGPVSRSLLIAAIALVILAVGGVGYYLGVGARVTSTATESPRPVATSTSTATATSLSRREGIIQFAAAVSCASPLLGAAANANPRASVLTNDQWSIAFQAQQRYVDALAKTPQGDSFREVRLAIIAAEVKVRDAITHRLAYTGQAIPSSELQNLALAYDARLAAMSALEIFLLDNGIVGSDYRGAACA